MSDDPAPLLAALKREVHDELTGHLLPFWLGRTLDEHHGGFVGRITQDGLVVPRADKGVILNTRLLWTFAAASERLGRADCREAADRAFAYLERHFVDPEHGGLFWSVDYAGRPKDTRKHVYAQAFAVYALSAYHRATAHRPSLDRAVEIFRLIERHAFDAVHGGYAEAFDRDWTPHHDLRLSEKDAAAPKSMNTHLHVLEAYTALYGIWPDPRLHRQLTALLDLFRSRILDPQAIHLRLFFDTDWTPTSSAVSFGHDIEAAWLMQETAAVLGDPSFDSWTWTAAYNIALTILYQGVDADGGLFNERAADGRLDDDKHWWPQAEAVVGFLNAYQASDERVFLDAAAASWAFIRRRLIDHGHGEWFWSVTRDGTPTSGEDKVGPWKGPYHNVRACLEILRRIRTLAAIP